MRERFTREREGGGLHFQPWSSDGVVYGHHYRAGLLRSTYVLYCSFLKFAASAFSSLDMFIVVHSVLCCNHRTASCLGHVGCPFTPVSRSILTFAFLIVALAFTQSNCLQPSR